VEDYSCRQWNSLPGPYRIPVHFLRFVFPDFRFADIPEGTQEEADRQIRLCLFNGIGTMTELAPNDPAAWVERIHVIERENLDAFSDPKPTALYPTRAEGVYCNRFGAARKTVLTLYNANKYRAAGQIVELPKTWAGYHWVDLLRCNELRVEKAGDGARAVLDLGPSDVAAIAMLPVKLKVRRDGERVWLVSPRTDPILRVVLVLADDQGVVRKQRPVAVDSVGFSLSEETDNGKYRAVLKYYEGGILRDLLSLPDLRTLDLAEDATASGSVRSDEALSVNGHRPGTYSLRWDDKERWVQLTWSTPQKFNVSALRFSQSEYSPQRYTYLISEDGTEWKVVADINREGKSYFDVRDKLPMVTTRFLRLQVHKGGPWGDATDIVRWRVFSSNE